MAVLFISAGFIFSNFWECRYDYLTKYFLPLFDEPAGTFTKNPVKDDFSIPELLTDPISLALASAEHNDSASWLVAVSIIEVFHYFRKDLLLEYIN